ncbi:RICIN domain-containing protein [Streptomyces chartreusis]
MARRLLTLLAALLLALSLGRPPASAASFANPVKSVKGADPWIAYHDGNYHLVTTSWTDAITIRKSPTLAGLASAPSVQVWQGDAANRCCNINNQKWRLEDLGDDTHRLVNVATGKVLDTENCSGADGADLRQWSWLNNTCQRFRFVATDTGYVRIVNQATGKVADLANCGTADGTDVRQWTWLNNTCQQWRLNLA